MKNPIYQQSFFFCQKKKVQGPSNDVFYKSDSSLEDSFIFTTSTAGKYIVCFLLKSASKLFYLFLFLFIFGINGKIRSIYSKMEELYHHQQKLNLILKSELKPMITPNWQQQSI